MPKCPGPAPDAAQRFLHVVYEYRYLALAGASWSKYGPDATDSEEVGANQLIPGITVLVQDSLLAHARCLIEFYTGGKGAEDITVCDFGLPRLSKTRANELERYKWPIDVHLMHVTMWRDVNYRRANLGNARGSQRQRVDWNRHNLKIIEKLLRALELATRWKGAPWAPPLRRLHDASRALVLDIGAGWPPELTEKKDVDAYLSRLGLR